MTKKKIIKLGALIILILSILILGLSYISTRLGGEGDKKNTVQNSSEKMKGMQGMKNESEVKSVDDKEMHFLKTDEGQMQENQSPSEFTAISISPEKQQLIGIKIEEVSPRKLVKDIRTVGIVDMDERKIEYVHVKFSGWIKDMFVYEGQYVKRGDPLFTVYSPDLVSSQEEYLIALKGKEDLDKSPFSEVSSGANSLVEAARRRFQLWDISEGELKGIEKTGKPITYMTIHSHTSGYVTKRMMFPGMHLAEGENVIQMADFSTIWVVADVYEYELPLVKEGDMATLELSYYPGEKFAGKVMYVYPTVESTTRTAKVRFEFPNPGNKLKPGMYANVKLETNMGERLSVAEDAVIDTGERKLVFIASGDGYFSPREIKVGQKAEGYYEVIAGLKEGEKVVKSAAFFVDSESRLKAALQSLNGGTEEMVSVGGGGETRGKSDIKISFSTDPQTPESGKNVFKFKITDSQGKPVTDAKVKFTALMSAMAGMSEMRSTGEAKSMGDGVYEGEINIPMSGSWTLGVGAYMPGKPPANESFDLNVK
jgi:multidrug efflux pump subunit AcrA (membrane-fusion protein)